MGALSLTGHNDYVITSQLHTGDTLDVTLTWFRDRDVDDNTQLGTDTGMANLDLQIWNSTFTSLLASSESLYNTSEMLHFLLPTDGDYGLRVLYPDQLFGDPQLETYGLAWNDLAAVPEPTAMPGARTVFATMSSMLSNKYSKNLLLVAGVVAVIGLAALQRAFQPADQPTAAGHPPSDDELARTFEEHRRNVEVQGLGKVVRILPDDEEGLEHQKFILQLASGQEVLVAHNTDVAPRIPALRKGDVVEFRGEYEWNPQGGVVHWTHHDERGRHENGWLKHAGQTYQ